MPASTITFTVGTRLEMEDLARLDTAALAAHLDRSTYIRRVLQQRAVKFYPAEILLSEAIALFCTMRVSVELNRAENLDGALRSLDRIIDRLETLSAAEARS